MRYLAKRDIHLPSRKADSHKHDNGTVVAVGGSHDYVGALVLASLAALRSGCDLVTAAAPEKSAWAVNAHAPDIMTKKLKGNSFRLSHHTRILPLLRKADVLLLGNGMGMEKGAKALCRKLASWPGLKVIDADGIKAVSARSLKNTILTPHTKELDIFLQNSGISSQQRKAIMTEKSIQKRASLIRSSLGSWLQEDNIILLKGKIDLIVTRDRTFYNKTGNAGMTKGGTGDVLAGLCAGLLAQSKDIVESAKSAAYVNGQVADILLKRKKGFTYLASDMVEEIGRML